MKSTEAHKQKESKKQYRPIRKNNELIFKALFNYWTVKLLDKTFPIIKDNRFTGHLITDYDFETKKVVMRFNARRLAKWSYSMILCGVFHEIRHIIQEDMAYETAEEQLISELDAELYAVKMLKQYYPEDLKVCIAEVKKVMKKTQFRKVYPIHYQAYKQIKEYS